MRENEDLEASKNIAKSAIIVLAVPAIAIFLYFTFLNPYIHVWQEGMYGQAELARAEYNRQIATLEAIAKKESSKALAEAEVIRSEGVAKSNKIIGDSLQNNEGYLRYLYIQHLSDSKDKTIVYIPTEAGLPILESLRLR
jgi:hypothetical protein